LLGAKALIPQPIATLRAARLGFLAVRDHLGDRLGLGIQGFAFRESLAGAAGAREAGASGPTPVPVASSPEPVVLFSAPEREPERATVPFEASAAPVRRRRRRGSESGAD